MDYGVSPKVGGSIFQRVIRKLHVESKKGKTMTKVIASEAYIPEGGGESEKLKVESKKPTDSG